jgi:hypothetical protein
VTIHMEKAFWVEEKEKMAVLEEGMRRVEHTWS